MLISWNNETLTLSHSEVISSFIHMLDIQNWMSLWTSFPTYQHIHYTAWLKNGSNLTAYSTQALPLGHGLCGCCGFTWHRIQTSNRVWHWPLIWQLSQFLEMVMLVDGVKVSLILMLSTDPHASFYCATTCVPSKPNGKHPCSIVAWLIWLLYILVSNNHMNYIWYLWAHLHWDIFWILLTHKDFKESFA